MRPCALLVAALVGVQSSQLPIAQCKFANTARNGYGVALGFPRIANRMRSTGVVNFTILFAGVCIAWQSWMGQRISSWTLVLNRLGHLFNIILFDIRFVFVCQNYASLLGT